MEAVLFTGAEALVVSVLTDRLKFLEGDRLDLLERHLFNLHLGFERLFFLLDQRLRFEGLWRIETGQQPTIEGGQIAGEIGRASCRERGKMAVVAVDVERK